LWNDTRSHKIYIFPPTFVSYALLNNEVTSNDIGAARNLLLSSGGQIMQTTPAFSFKQLNFSMKCFRLYFDAEISINVPVIM